MEDVDGRVGHVANQRHNGRPLQMFQNLGNVDFFAFEEGVLWIVGMVEEVDEVRQSAKQREFLQIR